MPDYAEVNTSPYAMTSFHGSCRGYDGSGGSCSGSGNSGSCNSGSSGNSGNSGNSGGQDNNNSSNASDAASAAPYASTTLVVRARPNGPNGSAMVSWLAGWGNIVEGNNRGIETMARPGPVSRAPE